jgi:putative sterol carrier protein
MALFPSDDWLETYRRRITESAEYRDAAATWEGDVAFLLEAEPDRHVPKDLWVWLDLWHGECRGARMVSVEEGRAAAYSWPLRTLGGGT